MNTQRSLFTSPESELTVVKDYCGISGLHYCLNFVPPTEQEVLLEEVSKQPWQHDLKRRVQHYGYKYDYKSRRIDAGMFVGSLPPFAVTLSVRLLSLGLVAEMPDQMIVNEYLPGQGITPHIDCEPCFKDYIVTISLGSLYVMTLTHVATGDVKDMPLELGSALVLSGEAPMAGNMESRLANPTLGEPEDVAYR